MTNLKNKQQSSKKINNPTGKGGFKDRPQDINKGGAPRKGQSWAETIKRITDMTREEAIEYVGAASRMGRLLKELPAEIPIKDAMIFAAIISFGREPNAKMFAALTDREEGKSVQPIDLNDGKITLTVVYSDKLPNNNT